MKGLKQFFFSMLIGFGHFLSFYFFIMAIVKLFYPENVGLYLSENNIPFIGYVDAEGFNELLGITFVPVSLVVVLILQLILNKAVRSQYQQNK